MRALFSPGTLVIVSGYDYFNVVGDKKWWVVKSKDGYDYFAIVGDKKWWVVKSKDGRAITSSMRDY